VSYAPLFPGRPELLTLAMLELAAERGVHEMSIRSLAAAVRAAPGSLTYHYRSKDEAFATCARFLGYWLYRDLSDRLATGGLSSLLPNPAADAQRDDAPQDEIEYARRWRVWIQLSAYGLNSSTVAAPVQACEQRMMEGLDGECWVPGTCGRALLLWSSLKALVTAVVSTEAVVSREAAMAALAMGAGVACATAP
jgi:AcrR family transcriptional regulator